MSDYLHSKLVLVGLGLLVFGSGPLLGIIVLTKLGLWPDPDPNPKDYVHDSLTCFSIKPVAPN
jgi:hypothetical protein